jgi:hypothetical protein
MADKVQFAQKKLNKGKCCICLSFCRTWQRHKMVAILDTVTSRCF